MFTEASVKPGLASYLLPDVACVILPQVLPCLWGLTVGWLVVKKGACAPGSSPSSTTPTDLTATVGGA
jgi:hypothetical protein